MTGEVYQEKVLEVEPYGLEPISHEERHGRPRQQFTIWFAINLNIVTWFTGFIGVEFGLSVKYAVLAILIGNITGAVFLALSSSIGPKLGQPLVIWNKNVFGKAGTIGLAFLNLLNNIGWFAVNLVLSIMALQKFVPVRYHMALVILTLLTLIIAVFGYNFIHKFAHWMSIVIGILFVAMTVISIKNMHFSMITNSASGAFNPGMFILTIAITFSYQISYCPIGSDYSRYLHEKTEALRVWLFSFLGCLSVCVWLEILGALTAGLAMQAGSGPMDFISKLMGIFTIPALITIILSIFPVNAMAIYSGGLAAMAMGLPMKRWLSAVLIGGLGALAVSFGGGSLSETYKNFLLLLAYWIAPWIGILLTKIYLFSGTKFQKYQSKGLPGVIAFIIGIAVSIPFMNSILYVGPIAKNYLGGADISYFLSMIISAIIYAVITPLFRFENTDKVIEE